MTKFEFFISRKINNFRILKIGIKYIYLFFFQKFFFLNKKVVSNYKIVPVSSVYNEYFFGYHDKSPMSPDGKYLIFHQSDLDTSSFPIKNSKLNIILKDCYSNKEITIFSTNSFNWQQGSRLHWLNNFSFIFNFYSDKDRVLKSYIYNINNSNLTEIPIPVYDSFNDSFIISIDFLDIYKTNPEYSYFVTNPIDFSLYKKMILKFDLSSNRILPLISYEKIFLFRNSFDKKFVLNEINHVSISPDGLKFVFVHRVYTKSKNERKSRLVGFDLVSNELFNLPYHEMISHFCWLDNFNLLVYAIVNDINDFYVFNLFSNNSNKYFNLKSNFSDGHPYISGDKIIFDSYPNRFGFQKLFLFDIKNNEFKIIAEFFHPIKFFGKNRCDLHPRLSNCGNYIFVDSVFDNHRKLYQIFIK